MSATEVTNVPMSHLRVGDLIIAEQEVPESAMRMFTVRREAPVSPLPTQPGYYVAEHPDYGGGAVVVELLNSPAGQWVDAGDRQYLTPHDVHELGSLVRLEPRAVTAKAVLQRVVQEAIIVRRDVMDRLRAEFGVEQF